MTSGYLKSLIYTIVSGSSAYDRNAQAMLADELEAAAVKIRGRLAAAAPKPVAPLQDVKAQPVAAGHVESIDKNGVATIVKNDGTKTTTQYTGMGNIERPITDPKPPAVPQPFRELSGIYTTGYYPPPAGGYKSKAEAKMEGGPKDRYGKPLRTLQQFDGSSTAYVSIATDPTYIPSKSFVTIDGFPGVIFYACDVGSAIKGLHIDICVKDAKAANAVTKRGRVVRVYEQRPII